MPANPATTPNLAIPRFAADSSADIAALLNSIVDRIDALFGAPIAYTPIWTNATSGSQIAIGNGSLTGRYYVVGKQVTWRVDWKRGSSTGLGADYDPWRFTFPPLTPATTWGASASGLLIRKNAPILVGAYPKNSTQFELLSTDTYTQISSSGASSESAGDTMAIVGSYFTA